MSETKSYILEYKGDKQQIVGIKKSANGKTTSALG